MPHLFSKLVLFSIATLFFVYSVESLDNVKRRSLLNGSNTTHDCVCLYGNKSTDISKLGYSLERNSIDATQVRQGWTAQPEGRGTIDIIWQNITTIFLCCWTALCLNVPSSRWGRCRRTFQKILVACLGIAGPEFIFQLALGQWASARRSVEEFRRSGYDEWSMTHAFLADMGGFVLHASDAAPFPLNAKQVHYLVENNYIEYADVGLEKDDIHDRNKSDGAVRLIAVCQIFWFFLNCVGRWIQHLAVTTLELTTLGFIVCTVGTYFFWRKKPMEVGRAITLVPHATIKEIHIRAGENTQEQYDCTPLYFVGRDQWSWTLYWTYWMNILAKFHIRLIYDPSKHEPIEKIPDANFPSMSQGTMVILFLFHMTYGAIPFFGWNFDFPTSTERLLWHIFTPLFMGTIVLTWIVDQFTWHALPTLRNRYKPVIENRHSKRSLPKYLSSVVGKFKTAAASLRNNSSGHDPSLTVPLKALIPITVAGACYCIARAYILLEDFINLRALPPSAYDTVNWSGFLPHF